jgi:hypothetical protein
MQKKTQGAGSEIWADGNRVQPGLVGIGHAIEPKTGTSGIHFSGAWDGTFGHEVWQIEEYTKLKNPYEKSFRKTLED